MTTWLNTSFQMQFRVIDGLTVRFAQSEDRSDHVPLLSPWPESLLAFEPVWARLADRTHLVAIDLPGFGHSQRSDALLSPRAMGEFIIRAAGAFGLEHPHVIAPDIGTPAALFAAVRHPGRLRSLVGGGAAADPLQLGGLLRDWVQAPASRHSATLTRGQSSPAPWPASSGTRCPIRSARTTCLPTRATGSPSRCAKRAPTRPRSPPWPACCRRSRPRY